ncbi:zinc finger protein 177-like [Adelges cooleyi]|uniref:zinc finger protein 177-like n=1 Tax=Adelges cooleyi TaxID=133065 RepID=UPI0021804416|nr:zinc finger protein 177-like [Adelges cooleyi]
MLYNSLLLLRLRRIIYLILLRKEECYYSFVGSDYGTTRIQNKETSVRKPNTVAVIKQEVDEIDNDCFFVSEMEIKENQDLAVIKDKRVHPHFTYNTLNSTMKYNQIQTKEKPTRSIKKCIMTHSAEKPFPCDICKKTFLHSGNLNKHIVTHTGESSVSVMPKYVRKSKHFTS